MPLSKLDHIAIEVPNLDAFIDKFVRTGGLKLLRIGTATASGARIAMLGDRTGMKLELIENQNAACLRFLHVAYLSDSVEGAVEAARQSGWSLGRGPNTIAPAKARSAFMTDGDDFEFQILTYEADSPDTATW